MRLRKMITLRVLDTNKSRKIGILLVTINKFAYLGAMSSSEKRGGLCDVQVVRTGEEGGQNSVSARTLFAI